MAKKATAHDAGLILKLYDLRREAEMRKARHWFTAEFWPQSADELIKLANSFPSQENAWMRQVSGYWDMAASFVTTGAIDADAFRAANGEIFATFSKIHPYLAELRTTISEPDICKDMEAVVLAAPDAEATLSRRREALRTAAKARASKELRSAS